MMANAIRLDRRCRITHCASRARAEYIQRPSSRVFRRHQGRADGILVCVIPSPDLLQVERDCTNAPVEMTYTNG
jgi:hypothetical protein